MNSDSEVQKSADENWYYSKHEKKLWRVKFSKFDAHYNINREMGHGISAIVSLFKSEQMGECEAVKFSNGPHHPVKPEYEISLKWPKGATGLLLRPKAYFSDPLCDFFVMHAYDTAIKKILFQFCIKERIEAIYQVCQGVTTLHNLGIAHRDIHLANIFYDKDKNRFDLGDFGLAITSETNKKEFDSGVNKDICDLKESIESILLGEEPDRWLRLKNGYKQQLNILEDILKLGFNLESSRLILDFMNSVPKNAEEILNIFKKIKNHL